MIVLGINPGSHDSAACLVKDGIVVAAVEEERLTRRKHAIDEMPWTAMLYCLAQLDMTLYDVDCIAIGWAIPEQPENSVRFYDKAHVRRRREYYRNRLFPKSHFGDGQLPSIAHVSHHLAHASSAYRCSPYGDAAILVIDGQGEKFSTSIAYGRGGNIEVVAQFGIKDSLGYFYQAASEFLGFGWFGGEGKTMGLAAYGTPCFDFPEFLVADDGYGITMPEPKTANATKSMLRFWRSYFTHRFGQPVNIARRYDSSLGYCRKVSQLGDLQRNIAASVQFQLEKIVLHLVNVAMKNTSSKNLALSGGVTLNCSANGKVSQLLGTSPFIFPAAGDAGVAVGAALEVSAALGDQTLNCFHSPYLGPDFSDDAIEHTLIINKLAYSTSSNPAAIAAQLLAEGNSVGWFQGRSELGPRALGHRSILADPRSIAIRDRVNTSIKHREMWRPFAPSMVKEASRELLGQDLDSPYMLLGIPVPDTQQPAIQGVVHIDGTTRPQIVDKADDPLYHSLIEEFYKLTGVPAVLNTSFNDENEPIVCTPRDAIRTFWSTGLDYLFLGPFVLGPKKY